VCGSLIRPRGEKGKLYTFHAAVTQYLDQYAQRTNLLAEMVAFYHGGSRTSTSHVNPNPSPNVRWSTDTLAAAVCMRYLSSDVVAGLRDSLYEGLHRTPHEGPNEGPHDRTTLMNRIAGDSRFHFLQYAVEHWADHARYIDEDDGDLLTLASEMVDTTKHHNAEVIWCLYWWFSGAAKDGVPGGVPETTPTAASDTVSEAVSDTLKRTETAAEAEHRRKRSHRHCCPPANFSGLHIAAYFGLHTIVKHLLWKQPHIRTVVDGEGRTPLYWAEVRGHGAVVRLLMDT